MDYVNIGRNMTAKPRKDAKPTISVTVVRKIDDDCAGSRPNFLRMSGMSAPDKAAAPMYFASQTDLGEKGWPDFQSKVYLMSLDTLSFIGHIADTRNIPPVK